MDTSNKYQSFNDGIFGEFKKLRSNFFECQKLVGEIIGLSQDIEFELKKLMGQNEATEGVSLDKIRARKMVNTLLKEGYFDTDYNSPKALEAGLNDVIDCRNWVVHTYFNERGCKRNIINPKETEDEKFLDIVRRAKMFSKDEFEKLKAGVENNWNIRIFAEFARAEPRIDDPRVSNGMDWSNLKLVITKWLLYDFCDALQKSPLSIFAGHDYREGAFKNYLHHLTTREELRAWLEENHDKETCAWVPMLSKHPDGLSYLAIVEEAICFGWIDSTKQNVGSVVDQRISPRRKKSNWTELNKERARRLIKLELMTEAGLKVLPDLDDNAFVINPDIMSAIKADDVIYKNFMRFPPLYVRVRIDNIQSYPSDSTTYKLRLEKFLQNTKKNTLIGEWNDNGRLLDY